MTGLAMLFKTTPEQVERLASIVLEMDRVGLSAEFIAAAATGTGRPRRMGLLVVVTCYPVETP